MDKDLLLGLMKEEVIPLRAKFDDFIQVALGVRPVAQLVIPAELPDAAILGATIDDRFRQKMSGRRLPGESLLDFVKGKTGKILRRSPAQELNYRMNLLRDIYSDVVEKSYSYVTYMKWAERLGLMRKELESRPTIREIYLFKDSSVLGELEELQDLRKDIRWETMRAGGGTGPAYLRAFPEERRPRFVKKLGQLLGFPRCCVERYVFDRESGILTPEVRASNQVADPGEEVDPFAFFTKDFFPCQPDCAEASRIGRQVYEKLRELDRDVAEQFRESLNENVSLVRRYPDIIRERVQSLEALRSSKEGSDNERDSDDA